MITPGREMTEAEAGAPIGHLEGRFASQVPMNQCKAVRELATKIGVNWFESPYHDGTTWFVFRGPAEAMVMFHEHCCKLSGDEPNVDVTLFDSRDNHG